MELGLVSMRAQSEAVMPKSPRNPMLKGLSFVCARLESGPTSFCIRGEQSLLARTAGSRDSDIETDVEESPLAHALLGRVSHQSLQGAEEPASGQRRLTPGYCLDGSPFLGSRSHTLPVSSVRLNTISRGPTLIWSTVTGVLPR